MITELPDLHIFACVAETRSFQQAAKQMQMARSSVSTRIGRLEQELGVTLFNRSTRSISLTDAGHTLYRRWQSIEHDVGEALAAVRDADERPMGRLRVAMPSSFGAALMPALVDEFFHAWPDLKVSIEFREDDLDVVGLGLDVVIRCAHRLPDSRLMAKRLASTKRVLAASPEYLDRHGMPKRIKDLSGHRCLGLPSRSEDRMTWTFEGDGPGTDIRLRPAFATNSSLALILAACLGYGVLYCPHLLIESEIRLGRLQVIDLEDARGGELGVFAVYPQSKPPAKVRVFVDFIEACLGRLPEIDRWAPLQKAD